MEGRASTAFTTGQGMGYRNCVGIPNRENIIRQNIETAAVEVNLRT